MVKKKDDIPDWVSDEIQNAKFKKPEEIKKSGYILEFYYEDNKIDVQLYDAVEDGRHIVTMDVPKKIKIDDLLKGEVYEFVFDQHKAPLSKKVSEFLEKEKEIEMKAIYQFDLKSLELLDVSSDEAATADDDTEE
jgi:mRNA-degrading endonuclease HigB of HigAB toxin-antitoxin module